jgi:hypothetical protein
MITMRDGGENPSFLDFADDAGPKLRGNLDGKLPASGVDAEVFKKPEIPGDDVPILVGFAGPFGVEDSGRRFPQVGLGEADSSPGAGKAGRRGRLQQSLKIERRPVPVAQPPQPAFRAGDNDLVDSRDEIENVFSRLLDQPGDASAGKGLSQGRKGRQGVNDISQGTETDDKKGLIRTAGRPGISGRHVRPPVAGPPPDSG